MIDLPASDDRRYVIADFARSLLEWVNKYAPLRELDRCGDNEVERVARDIGVTAWELRALAMKPPESADLLYRRLAVLRLDPKEIRRSQSAVLRDLQVHCSMCASKRRCLIDFAEGALDSTWQDYCPNAYTLRALLAENPEPNTIEELIAYLNAVGISSQQQATAESNELGRKH